MLHATSIAHGAYHPHWMAPLAHGSRSRLLGCRCRVPLFSTHSSSSFSTPTSSFSTPSSASSSASSARASDALSPHPSNNVPLHIAEKLGRNLHLQPDHPLSLIRTLIEDYWQRRHASLPGGPAPPFRCESDLHPIVNTRQCFDDLLIAPEHVSRRPSDTFSLCLPGLPFRTCSATAGPCACACVAASAP